ncbi:MAG: hypothetical protein IH595_10520 [Bacteroidales bacterium]|nr:hypothetical protein [Bacteroidales bacterium]
MSILKKQTFILTQLRELGTNIQPVKTHDFIDDVLSKTLTDEEIKVCFSLLEKKKFIEVIPPDKKDLSNFSTAITDEGMEELERFENQEKERIRFETLEHITQKNSRYIVYLTVLIAIGTVGSLVWNILKYFQVFGH